MKDLTQYLDTFPAFSQFDYVVFWHCGGEKYWKYWNFDKFSKFKLSEN